jgi:hypothetical protein
LNVHRVSGVRQIRNTAEPSVPDPSPFDVKIAITRFKNYKSPCSDEIPAEPIHTRSETLHSDIHKLIDSIWSREELPDQWKESINVAIFKKGDKTDCGNYRGISRLSTSYKNLTDILLSRLSPYID